MHVGLRACRFVDVGLRAGRFIEVGTRVGRLVEACDILKAMVKYVHDVIGYASLIKVMRL